MEVFNMSLFKERAASSKKVIALENEIISLKQQLSNASPSKKDDSSAKELAKLKKEFDALQKAHSSCANELSEANALLELSVSETADLKSDLKKVRSENTRLKKKLSKLTGEASEDELESEG
jgi:predicted  nucleic acid-binding Zn-ribbon protein